MGASARRILVVNAGSSSLKYALYLLLANGELVLLACGMFEYEPNGAVKLWKHKDEVTNAPTKYYPVDGLDRASSLLALFELVGEVDAVVHRVVMGRGIYLEPFQVTETALAELEKLVPLAPLHQPHNLAPIRILMQVRPGLLQIGSPDNGFHRTIRGMRKRLAVSNAWHKKGVKVHGWHGHSYQFVSEEVLKLCPRSKRVVIAHLGSGCSLCAVKNGKSVDTTMTFTPLSGLIGSTRVGSLDAAVALYMLRERMASRPNASKEELLAEVEAELWKHSGLIAIGGEKGDMRELLASRKPAAKLAVNVFVLSVVKHVAAMAASMGGIDALVFTGGMGENSAPIRKQIVKMLEFLGFKLDTAANEAGSTSINREGTTPILVIRTNEELVMASAAVPFLTAIAA